MLWLVLARISAGQGVSRAEQARNSPGCVAWLCGCTDSNTAMACQKALVQGATMQHVQASPGSCGSLMRSDAAQLTTAPCHSFEPKGCGMGRLSPGAGTWSAVWLCTSRLAREPRAQPAAARSRMGRA